METTPKTIEEPYSRIDHYHCWEKENPPCGQRIEHYKCCLCEKLNPKISRLKESMIKEDIEWCEAKKLIIPIQAKTTDWTQNHIRQIVNDKMESYNQAIQDFITYKTNQLK